jgi:hypothetical protein
MVALTLSLFRSVRGEEIQTLTGFPLLWREKKKGGKKWKKDHDDWQGGFQNGGKKQKPANPSFWSGNSGDNSYL